MALTLDGQVLDAAPLPATAVRGQAEPTDAPASSHSGAQDVVGVQVVTTLEAVTKTPLLTSQFMHTIGLICIFDWIYMHFMHLCWVPSHVQLCLCSGIHKHITIWKQMVLLLSGVLTWL